LSPEEITEKQQQIQRMSDLPSDQTEVSHDEITEDDTVAPLPTPEIPSNPNITDQTFTRYTSAQQPE
jgi:hypothetical protein